MPQNFNLSDTLRNPTLVDRTLDGQLFSNAAYSWQVSVGTFLQRAAEPKRTDVTVIGADARAYIYNVAGGALLLAGDTNIMMQAPVTLDSSMGAVIGTIFDLGFAGQIISGVYVSGGIAYGSIAGRPGVALAQLSNSNRYAVRTIKRGDRSSTELWISAIDEVTNPSHSFYLVDVYPQNILTPFNIGIYSNTANAGGFLSPAASDSIFYYPALLMSWSITAPTTNPTTHAQGSGYITTQTFDFSLANSYSYTLPTSYNDSPIAYSSIEFINVGNIATVFATINSAKITIPANGSLVLDTRDLRYPQFMFSAVGGTMRVNAYAGTPANYQSYR